jgi:ABC-type uncharacterized transport system involved in gliding motility auxiliary subunit
MRKFTLQNLFWFGPMLAVMGLAAGLVANTWFPIPLALIVTGIAIMGTWFFWISSSNQGFWGRRTTQVSTNAAIATLSVLAILAAINFLGTRYTVRWDLTENQLLTLAPQSQQVVRDLQQPLKVWVFDKPEDRNSLDRELLENYRRYSSQFSFEVLDPQEKLGLAQEFGVKSPGQVYLEFGKKRQLVQSLFVPAGREQLSEEKLTNGIIKITGDRLFKIYFLQGHGELPLTELSQAVEALQAQNYTVASLNLIQQPQIPSDATAIAIVNPRQPLFTAEIDALKNYLDRGGSLLVMANWDTNPRLDSLLSDWGVKLSDRLAIDVSRKVEGLGADTTVVNSYGQHPITKDFGDRTSFYPLAQPVEIKAIPGIESTPLLRTDEKTWAESNPQSEPVELNPSSDTKGPLTLGVALQRQLPSQGKARLVVFGNANFAGNALFDRPELINNDVFLNSVVWLSQQDRQTLSIRPKEVKNRRFNLTSLQASIIGWMAVAIIPLIGFATAGILWWRRR